MALNAAALIRKLPIIDENILGEAAIQPQLFIDAARYRVSKMRLRAQAYAEAEYVRSVVATQTRSKLAGAGERPTDKATTELLGKSKRIREATAKLDRAFEAEEFSKLLLDAFRMRRDAIRVIAESQNLEAMRGGREVERIEEGRKLRQRAIELERKRRRLEEEE